LSCGSDVRGCDGVELAGQDAGRGDEHRVAWAMHDVCDELVDRLADAA